jgi:hypothetical protein
MIRPRIAVVATTASIALTGAIAPTALAGGSHWSQAKCIKVYNAWYKAHVNPKKGTTVKQNKQLNAFIEGLEKKHHCELRG